MDNSPKYRKTRVESTGGFIGLLDRDDVRRQESLSRVRLRKWSLKHEATGGHRKNLIAAAIRRLNYKRDEAKGNG